MNWRQNWGLFCFRRHKIRSLQLRATLEILEIWPCTRDWPRTGRQPVKRMCSYVLLATCVLDSVSLHTCVRIHAKSRIWNTAVVRQYYQKRRFRPSAYSNCHEESLRGARRMKILIILACTESPVKISTIRTFRSFKNIINELYPLHLTYFLPFPFLLIYITFFLIKKKLIDFTFFFYVITPSKGRVIE